MERSMNDIAESIFQTCEEKGFTTPRTLSETELALAKLMLIVTEVSEAAEAVRDRNYEGLEEELAHVIIRVLHMTAGLGIDIDKAVTDKMKYNRARPYLHGRRI